MRKLALTCLAAGLLVTSTSAQTLFSYGGNPVSKEEFLRVYEKNSLNKKPDFSEPALREYLDLYSLFRMKVREADIQHLDTLPAIGRELDNYRKQLAKNYLTDDEVTNKLIKEAYDRMKEEVHVQHILIMSPVGTDTMIAYKKIDSIYKALQKGANFAETAKAVTEDKGTKDAGGDLGFVTAMQTVYPFENNMYSTPVGKISAPFRTQFGYHIVKVIERRPARGEVKVAHIMAATPKSRGEFGEKAARMRIDSAARELRAGVPWDKVVEKYSEDKFSKENKGELAPISVGRVAPAFEEAAFALKKPGDISEPIRTEYGFHIIKLIEKYPMKPFDSLKTSLKKKVENDSRAQTARDIFFTKIKERNGFKEYKPALEAVLDKVAKIPDTGKGANTFNPEDYKSMQQPVFVLAGKNYTQSDLAAFAYSLTHGRLNGPKRATFTDIYKLYVNNVVNDFEEHKLVEENPDFKHLMEEYRDGIMLFELMDRNVWGKASRDTTGLQAFYDTHKSKYMWEPGFVGSVYKFKNDSSLKEGLKLLNDKSNKDEDLIKKLNSDTHPEQVTVQHGHYEFSKFKDVPEASIVKGKVTTAVKNADGSYTVVRAEDVFKTPTQKSLDDARGYVVAEYQDYLEKQWNEQMRTKYHVSVNEDVFKSMVRN
ncbi:MAG: peptidylprolyl isomerase [Bacteroidetes bacterium]|nr:peptidylprolyl isomerase [Bacteroidota bacterium]